MSGAGAVPRPLKIGIGGPVGSGKTALVETLARRLRDHFDMAVITNDIYTQEDAQFLVRRGALPAERVVGVETGGCPHTAIREDASVNLEAVHELLGRFPGLELLFVESGGDNLSATFSPELVDATIYVIDVAEGDKIPRKGGPGIMRSDLLVINKIDLAPYVGADLGVMERDAKRMRGERPFVFTNLREGDGADAIVSWIRRDLLFDALRAARRPGRTGRDGRLAVAFEARGGRTVLVARRFTLPLQVLEPMDLDGDGVATLMLLNPTGGLLAGDRLDTEIALGPGCRVCCSTPSATRVYRSPGPPAVQRVAIEIGGGASLEWHPDHLIPSPGARLSQATEISMAPDATLLYLDAWATGARRAGRGVGIRPPRQRPAGARSGRAPPARALRPGPAAAGRTGRHRRLRLRGDRGGHPPGPARVGCARPRAPGRRRGRRAGMSRRGHDARPGWRARAPPVPVGAHAPRGAGGAVVSLPSRAAGPGPAPAAQALEAVRRFFLPMIEAHAHGMSIVVAADLARSPVSA